MTKKDFVPKVQIQKEMYAGLSEMYGREVPLYKLLLAVNRHVNNTLAAEHPEWNITPEMLDQISSERHGAIRIATPEEFKTMIRFFKVMDMDPHNAYLMTEAGKKSQPLTGTGFRNKLNPSQRMFCSTLIPEYFEEGIQGRIKDAIKDRDIFSGPLLKLIEKSERQGGLRRDEADQFVKEAQDLFAWKGKGHHYELYKELQARKEGVAADIVCFSNPHLNHLTPSSLDIDRLVQEMKDVFKLKDSDKLPQEIKNLLKNVSKEEIDSYLNENNGLKDTIEGPATPKPGKALVFLRQWSYKALSEKASFVDDKGELIIVNHTARFGEIEQRGVAMTPKGRKLYDECLKEAEKIDVKLAQTNYAEYEKRYAECFKSLEKTHDELRQENLAYYSYAPTEKGKDAFTSGTMKKEIAAYTVKNGTDSSRLLDYMVSKGYIYATPLRYDDFLPVSAAGIFASNLSGSKEVEVEKINHAKMTKEKFERMTGVKLIDSNDGYAGYMAQSAYHIINELGLRKDVSKKDMKELIRDISKYKSIINQHARAA